MLDTVTLYVIGIILFMLGLGFIATRKPARKSR